MVVPRGSVKRALKEEEPPPPAEGQQPDALRHQMTFLLDVCHVPIDAVSEKQWAVWRNESNWTVLHLMAEHINARREPQGWLNLVQVEDFITIFKLRGGDIDAFTDVKRGNQEPGKTALHIVAQRWELRHEMHEDCIRFAQALIVQGKANVNLAANTEDGRVPLSRAITACRLKLAFLLVKQGADPEVRDNGGLTVWEACENYTQGCDEVRRYMQKLVEERELKRSRITEL